MHKIMPPLRLLTSLFIALALVTSGHAEVPASPAGYWKGHVFLPTLPLAIHVDLAVKDGQWSGTIDIPAQGLRAFPLQPVKVEGAAVQFGMPKVPGDPSFSGQWDKEAGNITGEFAQNGIKFPFKLEPHARPAAASGETPAAGVAGEGLAGYWQASFRPAPGFELRIVLDITRTSAGTYEGLLISVDQGQARIPITSLTEDAGKVAMKVAKVRANYEGTLKADGSEIAGEWQQGGPKQPLVFKRLPTAPDFRRPQDPKKPYPYQEEEVSVANEAAGVTLAGTLTIPPGPGPHPAVVLITGSGPQDRDEALMGHRPFLVLADHLTRAGIAVLRCDDRGMGKSTGDFGKAVIDDFVTDTLASVAWLQKRPEIDPRRIGLVGHSEGGIVAPLAAVKQPEAIALIVLLAGVGVPVDELLIRQTADLQRVAGVSEKDIARNQETQHKIYAIYQETKDPAEIEKQVREIMLKLLAEYNAEQRAALGLTDAMVNMQSKMVASPWFRNLVGYDPRPVVRQVKCPVLAINGEKDLQVSAKENLAGLREALTAGGNTQVKIEELPGLNHLFQTCTSGSVAEYGQIDETFAPIALELISSWLRERLHP